ncbi:magnesium transporter [Myxococcus xanthus DK 1622]|uniref:Magnesium transporter MgtE n=1 Tax=Myxococcus xanthus (strain DK1622) TaxID=246197 RepID=Q1DFC1_MYXXD|nr:MULTISPECIES: magnesium transporter [Myxococcus]ABF88562.1 magnesium transporter [Myxococcus xanthus DK 1622]QPM80095.1 magnesium transporter [Myxococcus xanthus]QQR44921.1 magnesium transporter [Myxococcus xanthus]QVW69159.1 magnesium transporter [Myxococcus xanthus DZ2]QZZ47932.1 Magnesium transporter MgtE [Myxococcus xanthus]
MMESPQSAALSMEELHEAWPVLSVDERLEGFRLLPASVADDFFLALSAREQAELILHLQPAERRTWVRLLPPDDLADLVQAVEPEQAESILSQLDDASRREVNVLLAYAEDDAGGLMNPRFARVRPDMSIDEAISYLRKQARERVETVYYAYVLDAEQHLLGVLSLRQLFQTASDKRVADVMQRDVITVSEDTDQEAVSRLFTEHGFMALPVLDVQQRMKGIVTVDDIVDVVQEEATEDIQKAGGMEALEAPYFETGFFGMLKKRIGWLLVLFLGQMLTATAMSSFEDEIATAVVLSLFVPLIISSGGNSGSQASTLIIRSLALGEMRLRDWWRVARRELLSGLVLGVVLGVVGLARILIWNSISGVYGEHALVLGITVALSVLGVVTFGTLAGSMLPLVLRKFGFDPASASAPFVATLVDVSGVLIYFTVASLLLRGTLL